MFDLLKDLFRKFSRDEELPGTYVCVKFCDETVKALSEYISKLEIQNPVQPEDLHSTILYSKVNCDHVAVPQLFDPEWTVASKQLEVWPCDGKNVLVMTLKSSMMEELHKHFVMNGGHHSYSDYTPHITLSYDAGDIGDIVRKDNMPKFYGTINVNVIEYSELDENW